ncbi:MAG: hypothetical protein KDA57_16185 [Planctomycetales bacterium]|nr:hypothetical protein [Planctomycetales bacterium]
MDKAKLTRAGRPALTFNVVEALVRSMEGIHRTLRNDVRFLPVADAGMEDARVRDAVWLHVQNANQMDFLETEVLKKGLIMGRAYYDVRVSYDDSFQGSVQVTSPRSQDIVLDPGFEQYDPEFWPRVFKRRWVSYDDILEMFGKEKADSVRYNVIPEFFDYEDMFMAQQMGALPYYNTEAMSNQDGVRGLLLLDQQYKVFKKKEVFVDINTGDTSEIPETWDRNRIARVLELTPGLSTTTKKVKTVRWVVTCEGTVMHEDDSPYKWFTTVPFFPNFVDGVSKGAVESILDPQMLYNKVSSQELHIINQTANSGYKVKTGTLLNMTPEELEERGAENGIVFELSDMDGLERLVPNSVPTGHDRISFKADKIMRDLVGVSQQARGFAREDVAGEAIMANQAAQEINLAGWLGNLHRTKQLLASRVMDCVQSHYTETRTVLIARGSVFKPDVEEVVLNQLTPEGEVLNDMTRGKYTTTLVPAPSRASMSEEDFKLLLELRNAGIAIPDNLLIELSPAANKAQIIQALNGDSNEAVKAQQEAELRRFEADTAKVNAMTEKEQSAAALNAARAAKFSVEANTDPDAAWERTERARIASAQQQHDDKMALERDRLAQDQRQHADDVAVQLTQIESQRKAAEATAETKRASMSRRSK